MTTKYTIKDFNKQYPTDDSCLQEIFLNRYGKLKICPLCSKHTHFHKVTNRKCYACQFCGFQLHPLADTIFHKSETPLKTWFYAIFLFSTSKNGVSAMEIHRQTGVTYKTAWRVAKQIRLLMTQDNEPLDGHVEIDETYIGGVHKGKRGRGAEGKTPIFGIVQRKGKVKAQVVKDIKIKTIMPIVESTVKKGTTISTDEGNNFNRFTEKGYDHHKVKHHKKQFVDGIYHSNTIDGFWSQLKRSINGTYHSVSPKYLQLYVDEFAFRYSLRGQVLFPLIISKVAKQV
jgi:transposase-like protein/predicted RNA-binding Zn-ribbon protein involved in translation (DUF1610 family)